MSETVISVQGSASAWHEAERATVSVTVSNDGPKRESVFSATTTASERITAALGDLHDPEAGPVTRWSADRVAVWSDRPWNSDGKQLPLVYHATLGITARFRDADALARFVEMLAVSDGVTVGSIVWELTDETRRAAEEDVRTRAVADAHARAETYARAAGLSRIEVSAIAEPGLLGDPGTSGGGPVFDRMSFKAQAMPANASGAPLAFTPDRIEVSALVEARYRAS